MNVTVADPNFKFFELDWKLFVTNGITKMHVNNKF